MRIDRTGRSIASIEPARARRTNAGEVVDPQEDVVGLHVAPRRHKGQSQPGPGLALPWWAQQAAPLQSRNFCFLLQQPRSSTLDPFCEDLRDLRPGEFLRQRLAVSEELPDARPAQRNPLRRLVWAGLC